MFSAIYFFNLRGDILIQRIYRDDIECVQCHCKLACKFTSNLRRGSLPKHTDGGAFTT